MNTEEVVEESTSGEKTPKKSNGKIFKETMGYSKSMKRLMQKYHCTTVEQYRLIRKKNKKEAKTK